MSISATPFALQNGSHSADLFRQAVSSLVPPGGGLVTSGDLNVTQTGTASMNVLVGVGRAWVPGTNVGNVTGGNFSSQAMYYCQNDAAVTVSVATSDATDPRIDVVYLAIQDSQYAGTTNTAVLGVATGVHTPGATYPTNAPSIPANAIALAWINVTASASSIDNAHITKILNPTLQPLPVLHSEWTFAASGIPTATVWGTGTLTNDAAKTTDAGFITTPGTDRLTFRDAGEYAIHLMGQWGTATTGRAFTQIGDGSTNTWTRASAVVGEDQVAASIPNFRCAANTTVFLTTYLILASGTTSWTGRVRVTRVR
jgi:hypothetical protein